VDQNREVFAIPGNVDNRLNRGAHSLIKDGAKLVESVEDILAELSYPGALQPRQDLDPEPVALTEGEAALHLLLTLEPKAIDDLIMETSLPAGQVSATLLTLEMKGMARRLPGNAYIRTGA
jgi:DNA processing protein